MSTGVPQSKNEQQQQQQQQPTPAATITSDAASSTVTATTTTTTTTAAAGTATAPATIAATAVVANQKKNGSPGSRTGKKRPAPTSTTNLHDASTTETKEAITATTTATGNPPLSSAAVAASTTTTTNNNNNNSGGTISRVGKDGEPLSEKKLRRLEKNRLSARECRRRKREATENMQGQINLLEGENLRLRLQLQVGEEAEQTNHQKQIDSTKALDELLKSGKASESEIYAKIEEYKEKFADYGRDRLSAMEFHLKNVERLLMPTQTTSFIMNTLKDSGGNSSNSNSKSDDNNNKNSTTAPPVFAPGSEETTPAAQLPSVETVAPSTTTAGGAVPGSPRESPKTSKELFTLLVKKLRVTPAQAAALKDSRFVAQEMDETLKETLTVLKELRVRLAQCGQDLETEFNCIRQILTPSQSAKFLVWVAQNKACMHMLNELWSKNYPSMFSAGTSDNSSSNSGYNAIAPTSSADE